MAQSCEGWVQPAAQPWLRLSAALALQSALDWWPRIDAVYCHAVELRSMFSDTLHRAMQGCGAHPAIRMTPVSLGPPPSLGPALLFITFTLQTEGGRRWWCTEQQGAPCALQPCSGGGLAVPRLMSLGFPAAFKLVTYKYLSCNRSLCLTVHFKLSGSE